MNEDALIAQYFTQSEVFSKDKERYKARSNESTKMCIFYDEGCSIYEQRPAQCRAYPFWRVLLGDKTLWDRYAQHCPAMRSNEGKLFTPQEIVAIASKSPI